MAARRAFSHRTFRGPLSMKSLVWSPRLLGVLMEELYMDDSIEELLGDHLRTLPRRRYAEAIALALVLRHSWTPDDLATITSRLGIAGANSLRRTKRRLRDR